MQNKPLVFLFTSSGIILSFLLTSFLIERRIEKDYEGKKFTYTCTMNIIYFVIISITALVAKVVKREGLNWKILSRDVM